MKNITKLLTLFSFFVIFIVSVNVLTVYSYSGAEVAYAQHDTWVRSNVPDENNEGGSGLYSGKDGSASCYVLLYFNETSLRESFLYGNFNDNIHIKIYGRSQGSANSVFDWRIYRITESWDNATVTWNTLPSISDMLYNYTIEGEDYPIYYTVHLDIYNDWLNVMEENVDYYGYILFAYGVDAFNTFGFSSIEGGGTTSITYGYDEDEGEEEENIATGDFLINWFTYAIFLVILPLAMTIYISGIGENRNPILMLITFMGSETLMTAISLSIDLVNVWFMLVIIIMDVMIIFGLLKSRG